MTTLPQPYFKLTVERVGRHTLIVRLFGDLDHESSDELVETLDQRLRAERAELDELHLDFGELGAVDSMGLSAILMVHRYCEAAHVHLHLDRRPPHLDRILTVTGTLAYLTDPCAQHEPVRLGDTSPPRGADPRR
ncbi:STAS domain-containing protein [Streptomyces otsuchiensis]|uniref:STAS domain-containing protein n=1 Tax=Streptomyces otsuchiensis TaxID=2681388 RepID=UPI00103163C6|nr:STAS domain-containing protein [Streptomyces otsuchiensis]